MKMDYFGIIIFGLLGYFVYGTLQGVLAAILFALGIECCIIFCIIPALGLVLFLVATDYLTPILLSFTGITSTWLTSAIVIYYFMLGLILNIVIIMKLCSK